MNEFSFLNNFMTNLLFFIVFLLLMIIFSFWKTYLDLKKQFINQNNILQSILLQKMKKEQKLSEKVIVERTFLNFYKKKMKSIALELIDFQNKISKILFQN